MYRYPVSPKAVGRRKMLEGLAATGFILAVGSHLLPSQTGGSANAIAPAPTQKQQKPSPDQPKSDTPKDPAPIANPTLAQFEQELWLLPVQKSLVWRLVGAAEGCVSVDGQPTGNYDGHVDPGNGVWNRGAFSYQFGNEKQLTPQQADEQQAAKLKSFYDALIKQKAAAMGASLQEVWNAIDLVNQAPLTVGRATQAATDGNGSGIVESNGSFFQRLEEAKKNGLKGDEAILEARVKSFINPNTGNYDTTFVSEFWLRKDQKRRMDMMNQAMASWQKGVRPTNLDLNSHMVDLAFDTNPAKAIKNPVNNIESRGSRLSQTGIQSYLQLTDRFIQ